MNTKPIGEEEIQEFLNQFDWETHNGLAAVRRKINELQKGACHVIDVKDEGQSDPLLDLMRMQKTALIARLRVAVEKCRKEEMKRRKEFAAKKDDRDFAAIMNR